VDIEELQVNAYLVVVQIHPACVAFWWFRSCLCRMYFACALLGCACCAAQSTQLSAAQSAVHTAS
jgi:hypothetical protein